MRPFLEKLSFYPARSIPSAFPCCERQFYLTLLAHPRESLTQSKRLCYTSHRRVKPMQKAKIFISYSRGDSEFALELAEKLRASGAEIWIDRLISAGQQWDRVIEEALETSDIVLVILSPTSAASDGVRDEWAYALEEKKRVVPVLHQSCKIPFRLRRFQLANFTVGFDIGFAELLKALYIEATSPVVVPPSPSSFDEFDFITVTLDAKGDETDRRKGRAQYVTEDLGGGVKLEMVSISGGEFMMGNTEVEADKVRKEYERYGSSAEDAKLWSLRETPQHEVTVSPFFMGKFQVTQAQWREVARLLKEKIALDPDPSTFKGDNLPVESVSWEEAIEFCERLSKATGKRYRLPTEAEWEYASRAGTTTPFAFGETITPEIVNYDGKYPYASAPKGDY